MAIVKKTQNYLNPEWLARTAKLAMKRGTAIVFAKDGTVFGILPKSGGSVNVIYEADRSWTDAVLAMFPAGAVFPFDNMFGGPATAKALRAYANIRLPEDGTGKAWIDPVTHAVHVKGLGATIHAATVEPNESVPPSMPSEIPALSFGEQVPKEIGKLLVDATRRDDNRPYLKRIYACAGKHGALLGATDGSGAMLHKFDGLPAGFSVDPTLVSIFDIVGYSQAKTETGSIIHYFRLSDGTVFVEKLAADKPKNIVEIMTEVRKKTMCVLMASAPLRKLEEDIIALGLGANDTWGGVLKFTKAGVVVMSCGQPVAEFDAAVDLGAVTGEEAWFALPIISRFALLGADMLVAAGELPIAYATTAATAMVAMPMSLPKPKAEPTE